MSMPRSRAPLARDLGSAEPPMITFQPFRSTLLAASACSSIWMMVGTQCEKVTFSVTSSLSRVSGT